MPKTLRFAILATLALLSGCSTSLKNMSLYQSPDMASILPQKSPDTLQIQYLGVGGHLFRYGDDAIMTAPSITNPHFLLAGPFMPLSSDHEMIDRYLPRVNDVEQILVGHAHYDHLMDVPYIMQHKAKDAHVYGSNTTAHIMAAAIDKTRIHPLNEMMARGQQAGEWLYNNSRRIRFMAIESHHAPHLMGIKVMTGRYEEDLDSLPWHAFGWKEGQTLAYLIDFLGQEGEIQHRVYYQDAASQAPFGLVPELKNHYKKKVDIAIITPASFSQVEQYPESIMNSTQARHFILGHWEDFFANQGEQEQRFVRAIDAADFFQRFKAALPSNSQWTMPELYSTQYFAPHGRLLRGSSAQQASTKTAETGAQNP